MRVCAPHGGRRGRGLGDVTGGGEYKVPARRRTAPVELRLHTAEDEDEDEDEDGVLHVQTPDFDLHQLHPAAE